MASTPSWPNLVRGNTGKNVCALQCLLNYRNGNNALTVDGSFGPSVENAVITYQRNSGLTADGQAGPSTLSKLIAVVVNGSLNNAARGAQFLLSKFESIDTDGSFGPASVATAKSFQRRMEIDVDGSVGPTTWRYLFGYSAYPGTSTVTPGTSDYRDYRGQDIFTAAQITLLNNQMRFYKIAGEKYNIPWQMIAAVHFRENSLQKSGPKNGNGPYQIWGTSYKIGTYSDSEFQEATNDAAAFLLGKAGTLDLSVDNNVKYVFFAYNGIASAYKTQAIEMGFTTSEAGHGEGSPYVMNRFDARRDPTIEPTCSNGTWGQIKVDKGPIVYPANTDYGAYVVYAALKSHDTGSPSNPPSVNKSIPFPAGRNCLWSQYSETVVSAINTTKGCTIVSGLNAANFYGPKDFTIQDFAEKWTSDGYTWTFPSDVAGTLVSAPVSATTTTEMCNGVKEQIDLGRPVLIRVRHATDDNWYHSVVGYGYTNNAAADSDILVIDPYNPNDDEVARLTTLKVVRETRPRLVNYRITKPK